METVTYTGMAFTAGSVTVGQEVKCLRCDRPLGTVGQGTIQAWVNSGRPGIFCTQACAVMHLAEEETKS